MATGGGVQIPIPQKRPTVLRQSKVTEDAEDCPIPTRPAPPLPGRPSQSVPSKANEAIPVRPQQPVPGRPDDRLKPPPSGPATGRPPPPVPNRTGDVSPRQTAADKSPRQANGPSAVSRPPPPKPQKPAEPVDRSKEERVHVSRRPEITIVSARPMSEVGFRDKGSPPSAPPNVAINSKPDAVLPPRPKSQPPKPDPPLIDFGDDTAEASNGLYADVDDNSSRGPPPPIPAAARPLMPQTLPPAIPPSAPERPISSPRAEISPRSAKPTLGAPPPVPRQPAVKSAENEQEAKPTQVNPKIGVPLPPVPRPPPAPSRPPPISPRNAHNTEEEQSINYTTNEGEPDNRTSNNDNDDLTDGTDNTKATGDNMYAVINKPKRPTIIRPGRPSVKETKDERCNGAQEPPKVPPKIAPRLVDEDQSPSENVDKSDSDNKSSSDSTPEFLKLRLKSTTVHKGPVSDNTDKTTAGSGDTDKKEISPGSGPPKPAPKPKPTVLPKPKIAAKPTVSAKPVVSKPAEKDCDTTEKKVPLDKETNHTVEKSLEKSILPNKPGLVNDTVEMPIEIPESTLPNRPGSVKRPTIIRPSRPAMFGSSENVRKEENAGNSDQASLKSSVDDTEVRLRAQPPLPAKRPVSMSNIPQALAQEAALFNRTSSSHSVRSSFSSSENLGTSDHKSRPTLPRPAARARPMSMMAGDGMAKLPPSSVSPRIGQRSPGDKHAEPHRPPPPTPGRKPEAPVVNPVGKSSSSDDDEEFVMAQTKPDRPQGPPRPSVRRSVAETELKKSPPSRPGGPPSRKMSSPEEPEKDLEPEAVKLRPARPGSKPSRPISVPVKSVLPSKPQLPKAGTSKSKGLPRLPPRPGPGHPAYYHMMCVPHGQALFDYTARQGDELSFKKGDLVLLVRSVDAEWVVGKIDHDEGMFPRNFVKVLMPMPGEKVDEEDSSDDNEEFFDASPEKPDLIGHGPRCRARFDFDGEGKGDLAFEEGDVIRLLERVGLEWRRGEINGRSGLFPLSFVEIIEDLPEEGTDVRSTLVTALFDFDGEDGDLSFKAGEKIEVKYSVNEEWLFGEIGHSKGQFPVQFIDHVPTDLPPLPHKDQTELSISPVQHQESPKGVVANAMSQWDTVEKETAQKNHKTPEPETPYCVGTYDFSGETETDLSFSVGDRIEIVERIDADWLRGRLNGHTGMFPAAFVDVKLDVTDAAKPTSTSDSSSPEGTATVALYDFAGEADNELTFRAGDQLVVQELVEGATDWRWGIHQGRRGIFPAVFIDTTGH